MSLYQGYATQRGYNPVKVPDASDKIRKQGLQTLAYMQEQLDYKNKQAARLEKAFSENIALESKLRDQNYHDKRHYGEILARAKWKQYETGIKNAKIKAEQESKDFKALLQLTTSGASLYKELDTQRKKNIDDFAQEIYRDYGIGEKQFNAIRNLPKSVLNNERGLNGALISMELEGTPLHIINRIRRSGGYMQIAMGKSAAQRWMKGLPQYLSQRANDPLKLPGYEHLTLNNAEGPNVELALQQLTSEYLKGKDGNNLFSSKVMTLSGANELIDRAQGVWRQRKERAEHQDAIQEKHDDTVKMLKDFIGFDVELGRDRGAVGVPQLIEHLAGENPTTEKLLMAEKQVMEGLEAGIKSGEILWEQISDLETLPYKFKGSANPIAWGTHKAKYWTKLEQAGLAQVQHDMDAVQLKNAELIREGNEFHENMIRLTSEGDVPAEVMQQMIGFGTSRGHHFAKGVQHLQKVEAFGLSTANDKVGTAALLAKSQRGEIVTTQDVDRWNLSRTVRSKVLTQLQKYNDWIPQEGEDGTRERLNFTIESLLNDKIDKTTSWYTSSTWNDARIHAMSEASRHYRNQRELGKSHEDSYEYARDQITQTIEKDSGYFKRITVDGRPEFAGANADRSRDLSYLNHQQVGEEVHGNPDIIHSKMYIPEADAKVISGKANAGTWPEMHRTALVIQRLSKGKVNAADFMQAQLQQVINKEIAESGKATTQLLPKAYIAKYKKANELITPLQQSMLDTYNQADVNVMITKSGRNPVYTEPQINKARGTVRNITGSNYNDMDGQDSFDTHGYNITNATLGQVLQLQNNGTTTLVGAYAWNEENLREAIELSGLSMNAVFDEDTQNKLFEAFFRANGSDAWIGVVDDKSKVLLSSVQNLLNEEFRTSEYKMYEPGLLSDAAYDYLYEEVKLYA